MTITEVQTVANARRIDVDVEDYATLTVTVLGGTVNATGVAFDFKASPDATTKENGAWTPIQGQRVDTGVLVTSVAGQAVNAATVHSTHTFSVAVLKRFRLNVSAMTGGPFLVVLALSKVPTTFTPGVPLATQPVSGTVAITNAILAATAAGGFKAEDTAHVSGDVGIATLGVRAPAAPAIPTSTAGDYGSILIDAEGKQILSGAGAPEQTVRGMVATNNQTAVAVIAAPGAGVKIAVTDVLIAGNGTAGTAVMLYDGATAIARINPNQTHTFKTPLILTANTALNATIESGTSNVWVTAIGYKTV